jgi:PTH2 family peptidyl-tRNA hydrolase
MNATAFFQQIQAGARPVIRFTQGAEDFEGYAELHMRARVVSIEERSDSVCILTVDFGEFDEHNRQFESSNYFDKSGNACLTAREAGDYKPVDTLYLPLDGDIYGFEVEDGLGVALYARYLAAKSSLSYVQWLEAELSAAPGVPREVPTAAGEGGRTHKQVLAMRKDLKMRTGKLAAQAAHASLAAVLSRSREVELAGVKGLFVPLDADIGPWLNGHFTKIALGVNSEAEARELFAKATALGIPCALIEDSGLTEFDGVPTITGVAIGPAHGERVNEVSGHLPLNL